ncbi:MAG TPA: YkvA family protein [Rudaea sp.]|nr:YkvA family protein [Rudaea sp.]
MALEFSIEITDQDLPFFMEAIKRAEQRAAGKSAQQILDEAAKTFVGSQAQQMPEFVRSRLACVENLVAMAADEGWGLSADDKSRVVSALTYFSDPEDLIPDNVPVLGFLDDAIMIEVVQGVLKPEIDAYADFCAYRSQEAAARGADAAKLGREEWLEDRRAELQARMRGRRQSYAPSGNWTPRFKFT